MNGFQLKYKTFDQLTTVELYHIWDLRDEVFLIEQKCDEKETDFKDLECVHLMIWDGDILVAYARLLPKGLAYREVSLGRVAVREAYRSQKIGRYLMSQALEIIESLWGKEAIKISAQAYLEKFYESFGFEKTSELYLEAGIPHYKMQRKATLS